ncbi:MAG: hypothetical protein M1822_000372 [Bathelium mastoideum]|nr:MAG: hypothetical protein M1822_000372 [Bathelium mastoideum]
MHMGILRQVAGAAHLELVRSGQLSTFQTSLTRQPISLREWLPISDRTSAADLSDTDVIQIIKDWTLIDLPFANHRLTFWDPKAGVLRSRAFGPVDDQEQQGNTFSDDVSNDELIALTEYVAAYDAWKANEVSPNNKSGESADQNDADLGAILTDRVYSEKTRAPEQGAMYLDRASHVSTNAKGKPQRRTRSLSVGATPERSTRVTEITLDTVYQYDPESDRILVLPVREIRERPCTAIRNYVEANDRQIAEAEVRLARNHGILAR